MKSGGDIARDGRKSGLKEPVSSRGRSGSCSANSEVRMHSGLCTLLLINMLTSILQKMDILLQPAIGLIFSVSFGQAHYS